VAEQDNVELTRRMYAAFTEGGVEAMLPYFAPDSVTHAFPEWVEESEYRGNEGIRRLVSIWTDNFDDFELEIHELRAVGNSVVALGETVGRVKGSGVPIRQPVAMVTSDFRDGLIHEGRAFLTWESALEAAARE
jgi:ketosteroid isomerase-like protein